MRILALVLFGFCMAPVAVQAAERVVTLAPGNPMAGAIRLGQATGGPSVHDVVPADVAEKVFTSPSDSEPANGWFNRTYSAALKTNGFMAKKPETARYELAAEVKSMAVTPLVIGSHHKSIVVYTLREISTGTIVWEQTQAMDFDVKRGMRFGAIGGALGAAAGGALTGQNPALTAAMITNQRPHRPFDVRIDTWEGIMRGFQQMAQKTMVELAAFHPPA
ncbi:hypothetical protein PX699_28015 [Sphingobium sp. H39-3-25]|uniref:hypothetical protein n=1 Tax=Sphingobium arseniciresistens TaxID=3030834 RepID=UPI0023B8B5E0|nr:hypothetical protein [Sphingobium arseniciresistens]